MQNTAAYRGWHGISQSSWVITEKTNWGGGRLKTQTLSEVQHHMNEELLEEPTAICLSMSFHLELQGKKV